MSAERQVISSGCSAWSVVVVLVLSAIASCLAWGAGCAAAVGAVGFVLAVLLLAMHAVSREWVELGEDGFVYGRLLRRAVCRYSDISTIELWEDWNSLGGQVAERSTVVILRFEPGAGLRRLMLMARAPNWGPVLEISERARSAVCSRMATQLREGRAVQGPNWSLDVDELCCGISGEITIPTSQIESSRILQSAVVVDLRGCTEPVAVAHSEAENGCVLPELVQLAVALARERPRPREPEAELGAVSVCAGDSETHDKADIDSAAAVDALPPSDVLDGDTGRLLLDAGTRRATLALKLTGVLVLAGPLVCLVLAVRVGHWLGSSVSVAAGVAIAWLAGRIWNREISRWRFAIFENGIEAKSPRTREYYPLSGISLLEGKTVSTQTPYGPRQNVLRLSCEGTRGRDPVHLWLEFPLAGTVTELRDTIDALRRGMARGPGPVVRDGPETGTRFVFRRWSVEGVAEQPTTADRWESLADPMPVLLTLVMRGSVHYLTELLRAFPILIDERAEEGFANYALVDQLMRLPQDRPDTTRDDGFRGLYGQTPIVGETVMRVFRTRGHEGAFREWRRTTPLALERLTDLCSGGSVFEGAWRDALRAEESTETPAPLEAMHANRRRGAAFTALRGSVLTSTRWETVTGADCIKEYGPLSSLDVPSLESIRAGVSKSEQLGMWCCMTLEIADQYYEDKKTDPAFIFEACLTQYESVLDVATPAARPVLRAIALCKMAAAETLSACGPLPANHARARDRLLEALELLGPRSEGPGWAGLHALLGYLHMTAYDGEKALVCLQSAVAQSEATDGGRQRPLILLFLALAHHALGRRVDASDACRIALAGLDGATNESPRLKTMLLLAQTMQDAESGGEVSVAL